MDWPCSGSDYHAYLKVSNRPRNRPSPLLPAVERGIVNNGPTVHELFDLLQTVHDEQTFIQFLEALRDDREASVRQEQGNPSSEFGPDAGGWENVTFERFLDSA